jgi:HKD family nuclease
MKNQVILVSNADSPDHAASIRELFHGAEDIRIAVAFLKRAGAEFIVPILERQLVAGATVDLFVGTDFFHTDPCALKKLLTLKQRHTACMIRVADRAPATFHPKIYAARAGGTFRSLIGSANMTRGALEKNEELSLCVVHVAGDAITQGLDATFERYRKWARLQELDPLVLQQYSSAHAIDKRERDKYEKARDAELPSGIDLRVISDWYQRYLADPKAMSELAARKRSRAKALRLQRAIAALNDGPITQRAKAELREGLGDLMGSSGGAHLWGSGNIPRQGSKALEHEREMIRLFALAQSMSRRPAHEGYEAIRKAGDLIPGVGLNMATEMLCTFAPTRYAIYNGNTVGALRALGIETAQYAMFHAISPARYAQLCETIQALRTRIGATDLSEADAFLNWIYWEVKAGRLQTKCG